jgi:histidyl-tRNA synthetase
VKEQRWQVVDGRKVKVENDSKGITVKRDELVAWITERA